MNTVEVFDELAKLYKDNGYSLYMIGSSSRDYLLSKTIIDYDFVSDATPSEALKFLDINKVESSFIKYGVIKYKYSKDIKIDLVTLRKENNYKDFRHPNNIEFIKDINIDCKRRDFTINSIYIDINYNIIDPTGLGISDLNKKILRCIGDPSIRFKDDPLRILRGYRFAKEYNLIIEENTLKAMKEFEFLIKELNKDKIKEEERKFNKII